MTASEQAALVRQIWPLLAVRDINRSVEFYRDRLGFTVVGKRQNRKGKCFGAAGVAAHPSCFNRRRTKTALRKPWRGITFDSS